MKECYIMKIRGVNNMPDFIQVRDEKFALIAYFRADRPARTKIPLPENISGEQFETIIRELDYGCLQRVPAK